MYFQRTLRKYNTKSPPSSSMIRHSTNVEIHDGRSNTAQEVNPERQSGFRERHKSLRTGEKSEYINEEDERGYYRSTYV